MNKEKFNRSIDHIDIPIEKLVERERIAMSQGRRRKMVGRTAKRSFLVACGLCLTLLGSGFVSTGMAKALTDLPIIGHALEEFVYSKGRSLDEYKTVIGKTVEDNGVKVTLNEVILDEGQLLISSTFDLGLMDEDIVYNWHPNIQIFINGKELPGSGGGGPVEITDSKIEYAWAADVPDGDLEDKQNIQIVFQDVERSDSAKIKKGKWSFKFTASAEKMKENRQSIPINHSFTLDDGQNVRVQELVLTPVSTKINYTQEGDPVDLRFKLEDQNGKEIQEFSGLTMGYQSEIRWIALEQDVTKLKVIPYIVEHEEVSFDDEADAMEQVSATSEKIVKEDEKILVDKIFEINVK